MFGKVDRFPAGQPRYFFTKQLNKIEQNESLQHGDANDIYQIRVHDHLDQRWAD
jgi:hypothetical protein